MLYWLHVIAPMDNGFVGPFATRDDALRHAATIDHDAYVMTDDERQKNIAEFGQPDYTQAP